MDGSNAAVNQDKSIDGNKKYALGKQETHVMYTSRVDQSVHNINLEDLDPVMSSHTSGVMMNGVANTITDGQTNIGVMPIRVEQKVSYLSRVSTAISLALETAFFKVGLFVGEFPIVVIITMLIMCGLCGLGMTSFHETQEMEKLWVPQSSRLIKEKAWVDKTFPQETRYVSMLAVQKGGNVLTPAVINALMDYYIESLKITINGRTFLDMCVSVGPFCYVSSLLELWMYNVTVIRSLTVSEIITTVNRTIVSPVSGIDLQTLLGGDFSYNEHGAIVAAEATQMTWVLKKELDNSDAAEFERLMIERLLKGHPNISHTYGYATRSFNDDVYGAINHDLQLLASGFSIVFLFIILSLGKFNLMEQKIYVSLAGMACIGLTILASYGLGASFGLIYSPIQSILPFLLLGIGVDDMFVIVETWKNLSPEEIMLDVPKKLAVTLSRAGVSVTVTSLTDVVAFGISATTSIPALSSFCISATIGILVLYILVSTVFAGVLALDERRRKGRRDACLCCYKHGEEYTPSKCGSKKSLLQTFFGSFFGPFLMKLPVKIFIIVLAFVMAALGFWRFVNMRQHFDMINYLPSNSSAHSYLSARRDYFDRQGVDTTIYCGGFDYFDERSHLQDIHVKISQSPYIQSGTINSWFTALNFMIQQKGEDVTSKTEYYNQIDLFLRTPIGQRFSPFIKFSSTMKPISILATYITLRHVRQRDSAEDVKSMDHLRHIIDTSGVPKFPEGQDLPEYMCFAFALEYVSFETNKVLQEELYRGLLLSGAAVFLVTLLLIANLWTSLLVFLCVILTMGDVGGSLEVWGVTIDTASSILLTLSIGLAVDYSAHIGHTFMTVTGTKNDRAIVTLKYIGPAVFNGGFSTFLAFLLLCNSTSYGFQLFFKVFFTVVVFGLFHGLAFLPVILSLIGAKAYQHVDALPASVHVKEQSKEGKFSSQTPEGYTEASNQIISRSTTRLKHIISRECKSLDISQTQKEHVTNQPCISMISLKVINQPEASGPFVNQGFEAAE